MKVYTYYENINFKHQDTLLDLWKNSWEKQGFEAVILTRNDVEKHSFCESFIKGISVLHQFISSKPLDRYGLSCWIRWLAYATQPEEFFYVCDYDVINHNFKPVVPSSTLQLLDGDCPCIASGAPSLFNDLCHKFIKYTEENIEVVRNLYKQFEFIHYHDQEFFRIYLKAGNTDIQMTRERQTFFGIPSVGEFWKKQLVHYGHSICHKYCKENNLEFNEEQRCNIIKNHLTVI